MEEEEREKETERRMWRKKPEKKRGNGKERDRVDEEVRGREQEVSRREQR